jgi:hypothetical protein
MFKFYSLQWNEAAVVSSRNSPGDTEDNYEMPLSGNSVMKWNCDQRLYKGEKKDKVVPLRI